MQQYFKKTVPTALLAVISVFFGVQTALAQAQFTVKETLNWAVAKAPETPLPTFKGAVGRNDRHLPTFQTKIPLAEFSTLQVEVVNINYERCDNAFVAKYAAEIANEPIIEQEVGTARRKSAAFVSVLPFRKRGSSVERVTSFELRVTASPIAQQRNPPPPVIASALAAGDVYKIAVSENGIYKLDYNFLKNSLGIANLDNIDPRNIQVLGNGGGIVPESNNANYPDDLQENAVTVVGENDGKFDTNDYILFYGQGAYAWKFDQINRLYRREGNPYSAKNYYFIKIAATGGRRIDPATRPSIATVNTTVNSYDALRHYENDNVNVLNEPDENGAGKGSGRDFFDGTYFKYTTDRAYNNFNFDHIVASEPVKAQFRVAIKSVGAASYFTLKANGSPVMNSDGVTTTGQALSIYANTAYKTAQFNTTTGTIPIDLTFVKGTAGAVGFLDYITIQARCALHFDGGQLAFRESGSTYCKHHAVSV